jgi:hypothetical protein
MTSLFTSTHFSFELSNYRSFLSVGEYPHFKVVYDIKHSRRGKLKLKNGNDLLNMPGTIFLTAHDEPLKDPKTLGVLHYIDAYEGSDDGVIRPSPEHFSIECVVPREILNKIFDAEKVGLGPMSIGVSISDGLKYGSAPDGSEKVWESENDWVPVEEVSFTFGRPDLDNSDDLSDELQEPNQLADQSKEAIAVLTQEVQRGLLWITGLLVLIAGILAFKS